MFWSDFLTLSSRSELIVGPSARARVRVRARVYVWVGGAPSVTRCILLLCLFTANAHARGANSDSIALRSRDVVRAKMSARIVPCFRAIREQVADALKNLFVDL